MKNCGENVPPNDDSFASSIHYLLQSLDVAMQSAKDQCDRIGNYNVAWELKDELEALGPLLDSYREKFSGRQIEESTKMLTLLASIPDSVLSEATSEAKNIEAMQDPHWEPIREQAKVLRSLFLSLGVN